MAKPQKPTVVETPAPQDATLPAIAQGMTAAQVAYESKRAAKAGVSLEKWLKQKQRAAQEAARAAQPQAAKPPRKPGLFSRLLARARGETKVG
jgi:hypothetical protein